MDIVKGTPIKVTWLDADCEAGWSSHSDDEASEFLESYGLFVSLGPKFLTISFCHNADADDWLGKHRIPKGMIQTVEVMEHSGDVYSISDLRRVS